MNLEVLPRWHGSEFFRDADRSNGMDGTLFGRRHDGSWVGLQHGAPFQMSPRAPKAVEDEITAAPRMPRVVARYSGFEPRFDVVTLVEQMIATVPSNYLVGLSEVVLTNFSGLPRSLRKGATKSRKRKVRVARAAGRYHPAWNNQPAWIEIFVDNTLRAWERGWWLKFRFLREGIVGDVLFHEIGHHIHFAIRPEYREREDVADVWKARLSRNWSRQSYPLMKATAKVLKILFGPLLDSLVRRSAERELEKGLISRAEFEERTRRPTKT